MNTKAKFLLTFAVLAAAAGSQPAWACAACYGASDSSMAKGMNWGIFSLLAIVVSVLGGFAAFGVYLVRRAAAVSATNAPAASAPLAESPAPVSSPS